jgi:hypothetical protein
LPFPAAEGGGHGAGEKKIASWLEVLFMACSGPVLRPCSPTVRANRTRKTEVR